MTLLRRLWMGLALVAYFLYELVASSLEVAWEVLTPADRTSPGILAVPLDVKGDTAITVFANLVSLTPGTLSLDVSEDRRVLYVHAMFIDDPEADKAGIKETMERKVIEAMGA